MNQKEFCQQIVLIALAMCFEHQSEVLTIEQLVARGFVPLEDYCRACVTALVESKLIQTEINEPIIPVGDVAKNLVIRYPGLMEKLEREDYVHTKAMAIRELIVCSFDYTLYLRAFARELTACECIEYAEFYASRSNIQIRNASPHNLKLRLLVSECHPEQIRMLLWRALKKRAQSCTVDNRNVEFSSIAETAFDCYISYKRTKRKIDRYSQPQAIKTSILSGLLVYFLEANHDGSF